MKKCAKKTWNIWNKSSPTRVTLRLILRLILIGELSFQNFQSLEIIRDIYQDTGAFCHNS